MIYEIDPTAPASHMKFCALLHDDLLAYIVRYRYNYLCCVEKTQVPMIKYCDDIMTKFDDL